MKKIEEWIQVLLFLGLFIYGIFWVGEKLSGPVTNANNTIKENVLSGDLSLIYIILLFYLIVVLLEYVHVNKSKKYERIIEKLNINEEDVKTYLTSYELEEQERIDKLNPIHKRFAIIYRYLDQHPLFLFVTFYLSLFLYEPIKLFLEK
jgi:hypothetical protein